MHTAPFELWRCPNAKIWACFDWLLYLWRKVLDLLLRLYRAVGQCERALRAPSRNAIADSPAMNSERVELPVWMNAIYSTTRHPQPSA